MIKQLNKISAFMPPRVSTGIASLDDFLGGGIVEGSAFLFAGVPGSGKSSLLMQLSENFAEQGRKVLYVSGEENFNQIKARANRLSANAPDIYLSDEIKLEELFASIDSENPKVIVIDSIQMLTSNTLKSMAGSVSQTRYCLLELIAKIKKENRILFVIGHATKSGLIAGLLTLQHMVDVLLYLIVNEDGTRTLLSKKNRFGETGKEWQAYMTPSGLKENPESELGEVITKEVNQEQLDILCSKGFFFSSAVKGNLGLIYEKIIGGRLPQDAKITISYKFPKL